MPTVLDPNHLIRDDAALRALFPPTHDLASRKSLDHLDRHARDFLARAPFLCIGTQGASGQADVSPRGDAPGFVRVLDDRTLAIPDRPGNNRLDTMANIIANPQVGLLFMVPGFDDTLRVNGQAVLSCDPDLLSALAVEGHLPRLAIIVTVAEVFLHCAKAFRRSRLWDPGARQDRRGMPSLMQILVEQTSGAAPSPDDQAQLDANLEADYRASMY
jgi:PPOX class probable FMN-dependent enzyme